MGRLGKELQGCEDLLDGTFHRQLPTSFPAAAPERFSLDSGGEEAGGCGAESGAASGGSFGGGRAPLAAPLPPLAPQNYRDSFSGAGCLPSGAGPVGVAGGGGHPIGPRHPHARNTTLAPEAGGSSNPFALSPPPSRGGVPLREAGSVENPFYSAPNPFAPPAAAPNPFGP